MADNDAASLRRLRKPLRDGGIDRLCPLFSALGSGDWQRILLCTQAVVGPSSGCGSHRRCTSLEPGEWLAPGEWLTSPSAARPGNQGFACSLLARML